MEEKENLEKQIQIARKRVDLTKKLPASERRLDSFANLLVANSECVAVAIINGNIYISANELYDKSRENETVKSIKLISNYFYNIARKKTIDDKARAEAFLTVCSISRIKKKLKNSPLSNISEDLNKKVVTDLLAGNEFKVLDYGKNATIAGLLHGEFSKLYRDFLKLEEALKNDSNNQLISIFSIKPNILYNETKKGVHAELQILSFIVKLLNKGNLKDTQIFIGISKLRCLQCRCMIDSANEIFEDKNIKTKLLFRGQHDINSDNWIVPDIFENGYNIEEGTIDEKTVSLEILIGYYSKMFIDEILQTGKTEDNVNMEHSQSDSDPEDFSIKEVLVNINQLRQCLNFMENQNENSTIKESKEIISATLKLHDIEKFKFLSKYIQKSASSEEMTNTISTIWKELNQNLVDGDISLENFLKILKTPFLVGETIAKYFKTFQLLEDKKNESKEEMQVIENEELLETSNEAKLILTGFNTKRTLQEDKQNPLPTPVEKKFKNENQDKPKT